QADREPNQVHGHAIPFPTMSRLHRRLRSAERRCILDQTSRLLDSLRVAAGVEGHQSADAWIAHSLDIRMGGETLGQHSRRLRLALDADPQCLHSAEQK